MLILTIRTDKPEAEVGLYEDQSQLAYETWTAHRELGRGIHSKIRSMLEGAGKDWHDIWGVVGFKGPGSFTGLRIGLTVANTLASSLRCPIVGSTGEDWIVSGISALAVGQDDRQVMPEYGAEANITTPRK